MKKCPLSYVVLDIESTGVDPLVDEIIEIGILKISAGEIIDEYQTLVNLEGATIPDIITCLTGIEEGDLINAPKLDAIKDDVVRFISDWPVCGHNIFFDINFLQQKGVFIKNTLWDTLYLSAILLHKTDSLSLETLSRKYRFEHVDKHRALSDCKANKQLFDLLWEELINTRIPDRLVSLLDKCEFGLKQVFYEGIRYNNIKTPKERKDDAKPVLLDTDVSIHDVFKEGGVLSKLYDRYIYRLDQEKLAGEIYQAIKDSSNLIAEAPPGLGKSMGYLIPAILSDEKVAVSTSTLQLQNQLINDTLPRLKKVFPHIKYSVLKGRSNYLCLHRLDSFIKRASFDEEETILLLKILYWVQRTETGDKDELNIYRKEYDLFDEYFSSVQCNDDEVHKNCFYTIAKQKAKVSDILVINHYLLFSGYEHDVLVIDESHKLEHTIEKTLEKTLDINLFERKIASLKKFVDIKELDVLIEKLNMYFSVWGIFINEYLDEYNSKILIDNSVCYTEEYKNISFSTNKIILKWQSIKTNFLGHENDGVYNKTQEIDAIFDDLKMFFEIDNDLIKYVHLDNNGNPLLKYTIRDIGRYFNDNIKKGSVILISATLSDLKMRDGEVFSYIKKVLNLSGYREICIDRPTSKEVKVLIPKDIPEPLRPGNYKKVCSAVFDLIRVSQGRTLGLFTSYKSMESVYANIAPIFKKHGVNIYAQRINGGIGKIIDAYNHDPDNTVLFGVSVFWEGIDLKDNPIEYLFIHKLPFDHPNDPVMRERMKKFKDSFMEYSLPRSIIKFKQGVGRLIRNENSKGVIVILDTRIINKAFGKYYLDIFDDIEVIDTEELIEMLKKTNN